MLRSAGLDGHTTLARVEPHRLKALVEEDLQRYPNSGRVDIHRRIGPEIHAKAVMRAIESLVGDGAVVHSGVRRWRKYSLRSHGQES
jgi:ATP-dependent DNA helicase RecG